MRLFVYGSLMSGGHQHDKLRGSRFLGAATVSGHNGIFHGPNDSVQGEVWDVPEELIQRLDGMHLSSWKNTKVEIQPYGEVALYVWSRKM